MPTSSSSLKEHDVDRDAIQSIALVALLSIHALLIAWLAWCHSPTFDETAHLPAGISHWQFQRFDLYRVNPHLVRSVAALPAIAAGAKTDWTGYSQVAGGRPEFRIGSDFINANGADSFWLFTLARWACIPFSLLGAYICYRWSRELWGPAAGFIALTLWCISPNILGNAQTIQSDVPAAALAVTVIYLFWHWCRQPSLSKAISVGIALGLALLTKTTLILFVPLLPILWLIDSFVSARTKKHLWLREGSQIGLIWILALYLLNTGYLFDGSFKPLGSYAFVSNALSGDDNRGGRYHEGSPTGNRFQATPLAHLPVPLPQDYVLGVDAQKRDFEGRLKSYMRGQTRYRGWWYYYLYGMAVKMPIGTLALLTLSLVGLLWRGPRPAHWRDLTFVVLPSMLILVVVSSETGMNNHLRYVLPAFPFLFVIASWSGRLIQNHRLHSPAGIPVATAVAATVASSLAGFPHSHSYFNEFVGGPSQGHFHLLSSNVDYGEDLLFLKQWLGAHAMDRPVTLAYFGNFDPRVAGIDFSLPPKSPNRRNRKRFPEIELGPLPGLHAVSVNYLHGPSVPLNDGHGGRSYDDEYSYFLNFEPTARAGYGIHIYDLSIDDVNPVRKSLGLPLIPPRDL